VLSYARWICVKNADGIYSALVSGRHEGGKDVRLIIPLDASVSASKARYYQLSDKIDDNTKPEWQELFLSERMISCEFRLANCNLIRFALDGAKEPEKLKITTKKAAGTHWDKSILKVTDNAPEEDKIRTTLRWPNGHIGLGTPGYSGSEVEATTAKVAGVKNVVPWDKKSNLISIAFPKDAKETPGGATLFFGTGPFDAREFSFWVYPRTESKAKKLTFRFHLISEGKLRCLAADLIPEKWQRVIMPCDKLKPPYWGEITVVGDPKLPE